MLVNQFLHHKMDGDNTLHVVGVITNPASWHSRLRLFRIWRNRMLKMQNVKLYVVEGVYGDHHPECAPEPGQDYEYLKVQLNSEIWLKENLINIAVERLVTPACPNWKYLCWEDCDVEHEDPHWALKCIKQLQTWNLIQTWSHGIAFDANGGVLSTDKSFGFLQTTNQKFCHGHHRKHHGYEYAHTGYSWACTRYWWVNVERLVDFCLIGSADHHMAWCSVGKSDDTIHGSMSKGYFETCHEWQRKSMRACGGRIGYVHGLLKHSFHGPRRGRQYEGRWFILTSTGYDPKNDIAYDSQGVIYLIGENKHKIEGFLITYNRSRLEDSNESI